MGLTIYTVTDENRKQIKELIKRAHENVTSHETLKAMKEGNAPPIGDTKENRVLLGSYKVVFTIEENIPGKILKHISISCQSITDGRVLLPPIPTSASILKLFGFKNADSLLTMKTPSKDDIFAFWIEKVRDGIEAINIVELDSVGVEPDMETPFDIAIGVG